MKNLLRILTNLSSYSFTTSEFIHLKNKILINHITILSEKCIYELLMSFLRVSRYKNLEMKTILEQVPLFIDHISENDQISTYSISVIRDETLRQRNEILYSLADLILSLLYENDPYITQALLAHFTALVKIIELYLRNLDYMEALWKSQELDKQEKCFHTNTDELRNLSIQERLNNGTASVDTNSNDRLVALPHESSKTNSLSVNGNLKGESESYNYETMDLFVFVEENPLIYKAFCELFIALNLKNKELARNLRPMFQNIISNHRRLKKIYMSQRMYMEMPECLSFEDKKEIFLYFLYSPRTDNNILLGAPYDPYLIQIRSSYLFFEQIFFYFFYFDCIPYLQNIALSKFREMVKNDSIFNFISHIDEASIDGNLNNSHPLHCCKRLLLYNPNLKKKFFEKIDRFNRTGKIELRNSHLILRSMAVNKKILGQALGRRPSDSQKKTEKYNKLLEEYIITFNFHRLPLLVALRTFLNSFILPSESQQIERILEKFADRYYDCQPDPRPVRNIQLKSHTFSLDVINILTYMIIYLNTELHSPYANGMSKLVFIERVRECIKDAFLKKENSLKESVKKEIAESINQNKIGDCNTNTRIEQSDDIIRNRILSTDQSITDKYLSSVYDDIKSNPLRPNNTFQYELEAWHSFNRYLSEFGMEDVEIIKQEIVISDIDSVNPSGGVPLKTTQSHEQKTTRSSQKTAQPMKKTLIQEKLVETSKEKTEMNIIEVSTFKDSSLEPSQDEEAKKIHSSQSNLTLDAVPIGENENISMWIESQSSVYHTKDEIIDSTCKKSEFLSNENCSTSSLGDDRSSLPSNKPHFDDKSRKLPHEQSKTYDLAHIYREIAQDMNFTPIERMRICTKCKKSSIAILILRNIPQLFKKMNQNGLDNRLDNIITLIAYTEFPFLLVTFLCWYKERMKIKREKIGCYMKIFYSILELYVKKYGKICVNEKETLLNCKIASLYGSDEILNCQLKEKIPSLIQNRDLCNLLYASISNISSDELFFLSQPLRILNSYKKKSDAFFFKKTNEIEKMHIKLIKTISSGSDQIFKYFIEVNYRYNIKVFYNKDTNKMSNGDMIQTKTPQIGSEILKFRGKILLNLQLIIKKNIIRIELIDPGILVHLLDNETFQIAISLKLTKIFLYLLKIYQDFERSTDILEGLIHENEEFFTEPLVLSAEQASTEKEVVFDSLRISDLGEYLNFPKIFLSLCIYNDLFYNLNENFNLVDYLVKSKKWFENEYIIPKNLQIIDKNTIMSFDKLVFILSLLGCMYKKDREVISPNRSLDNIASFLQETEPKTTDDLLSMEIIEPLEQSPSEESSVTQNFLQNTRNPFQNILKILPALIENLDAYETQSLQLIIKSLFSTYAHNQKILKILMKITFLSDTTDNIKLQNYMIQLWHSTGFSDPSIDLILKSRKKETKEHSDAISAHNSSNNQHVGSNNQENEQFEI